MRTDLAIQQGILRQLGAERGAALRRLARPRPWRVVSDVAWCYAVILLGVALLAASASPWAAALAFVLIGNRQYALSIMAHDGKHGNLLAQRRWNDLFTIIALCVGFGVDFHGEWANHRAHHRYLGSERDPDRRLYSAENKATQARFLAYLSTVATFIRSLTTAARSGTRSGPRRPFLLAFVAYRWPTIAAQVLIFAAISAVFPWWYYLAFWIAPNYVLMFVPHKIRMFCEHAQPVLPDSAGDQRRLVTYLPNLLERTLLSPMNNNLHAEHHLWPTVPYCNLPAVHRLLGDHPLVEVRYSYVGFLWSYYSRLPLRPALPARA